MSLRQLIEWCQRRQRSVYYCDGSTLVLKSVGDSHLPAICFAAHDSHCYMYKSATWAQNLPVREIQQLPERVLPCAKHDKTPMWTESGYFPFQIEPGWYDHEDLDEVQEWLLKGYVAKVSINHKTRNPQAFLCVTARSPRSSQNTR